MGSNRQDGPAQRAPQDPDGQAAAVERLSQEVADLRRDLERANRYLEIVSDAATHFEFGARLPESGPVEGFVERLTGRFPPAEVVSALRDVLSIQVGASDLAGVGESEPSAEDWAEARAANQVWDEWVKNYRCYGSERLCRWFKSLGLPLSRREVARLMSLCGASALSYKASKVTMIPLVRPKGFEARPSKWPVPGGLNEFWGIDICPVRVGSDEHVVVLVVNVASRRIIDFSVRPAGSVIDLAAVIAAAAKVRVAGFPTSVGSSNRGVPRLVAVTSDLSGHGLARLTGLDASVAESAALGTVGRVFQLELTGCRRAPWVTPVALEEAVGAWVTWYNTVRLHIALEYRTPLEFECSISGVC